VHQYDLFNRILLTPPSRAQRSPRTVHVKRAVVLIQRRAALTSTWSGIAVEFASWITSAADCPTSRGRVAQ
jgi:hypothetical protein